MNYCNFHRQNIIMHACPTQHVAWCRCVQHELMSTSPRSGCGRVCWLMHPRYTQQGQQGCHWGSCIQSSLDPSLTCMYRSGRGSKQLRRHANAVRHYRPHCTTWLWQMAHDILHAIPKTSSRHIATIHMTASHVNFLSTPYWLDACTLWEVQP